VSTHPKPSAKNAKGATRSKFKFEEGQPALDRFTRTMESLFRVPKFAIQPHKPVRRKAER
jgi:hypothetical protein